MSVRENRFILGILFPIIIEIGLIQAYIFFMYNEFQLFLFLPSLLLIFPAFLLYIFSPYIIIRITRAANVYSEALKQNIDEIFLLKEIDLDSKTKSQLKLNIQNELMPSLKSVFRRGYIDSYFTRDESIANERMLTFKEAIFLFSILYTIMNLINFFTIIYLHFYSIDLDFLYIDQIVNPLNVIYFGILFGTFTLLSIFLFDHTKKNLITLIGITSYIRRFPLDSKIGRKLASNWDLVSKLYYEFIEIHINEELREYSRKEVARALVLEQYSDMLNKLDLPKEKRKELELQFYLGQAVTEAIDEIVSSEEETESIKLDVLYTSKKLENWDEISNDEKISTFLFLWRSVESLFRNVLWKRNVYPKDDQSWPSITNVLLKEKLLTIRENKNLKTIRLRRNAMLHRSQDRFVSKEDIEDLLKLLQSVIDRS
ncbi:MAG: hypothetical protein ACW964_07540 [Candidatus Hodarchaeales archaeon]|jgi:hypothetical protein